MFDISELEIEISKKEKSISDIENKIAVLNQEKIKMKSDMDLLKKMHKDMMQLMNKYESVSSVLNKKKPKRRTKKKNNETDPVSKNTLAFVSETENESDINDDVRNYFEETNN